MQVFKVLTVAVLAATVSIGAANAKSLRNAGQPAEFPSSSFKGKQYVDSKGCVFIRAGFSGNVTWVPRVSRSRKHVCGQRPTFAKAPTPAPAAKAPVVVAAKPAPKRVIRKIAAKPTPAPKPSVISAPKTVAATKRPAKTKRVVRRVVRTPAPAPTVFSQAKTGAQPKAARKPTVKRVVAQRPSAACQGASSISNRYINSGRASAVRCEPQAIDPTGGYNYTKTTAQTLHSPRAQTRKIVSARPTRAAALAVAPRVAPVKRVVRRVPVSKPPAGYKSAWKDGRLNPNRARGTAQGRAQMEMVWTNTVPRRLVAVSTSQDTKRRIVLRKNASGQRATPSSVSTKSAPVTRAASAASHRYVQVGTYGNAANANNAIARLRSLGLPVRVAKAKSGGRVLQTVLAGPFKRQANLKAALSKARRAGYGDAVLRR